MEYLELISRQGHISGLSLDEIVQAVYMLEQKMIYWQLKRRREEEREEEEEEEEEEEGEEVI